MDINVVVQRALNKHASLVKEADAANDAVATQVMSMIPYIGGPATGIGGIAGWVDSASDAHEAEYDKTPGSSWIPGVGAKRITTRLKNQLTGSNGTRKRFWSSQFGPLTSLLLSSAAGAGIGAGAGALVNREEPSDGALAGAGVGALAGAGVGAGASLLAALIAAATKRRTKAEQLAAADSSAGVAADYLLPGAATYNNYKSIGRSLGDSEERAAGKDTEGDGETEKASGDKTVRKNASVDTADVDAFKTRIRSLYGLN